MKFFFFLMLISTQVWATWNVSTFNIRNFDRDYQAGSTNVTELQNILRDIKSDVMAFEEVVNVKAFEDLVKKTLPGYVIQISGCGGGGKQKLAVVFNPKVFNFVSQVEDTTFSSGRNNSCGSLRPILLVTLQNKLDKKFYVFGVVHLKAGSNENAYVQRWKQYEALKSLATKYEAKNLILLGDFNTTGYLSKDEDFNRFETALSQANLRAATERVGCTNYWEGPLNNGEHQPSVLDHIVIQERNVAAVKSVRVTSHCEKLSCNPAAPVELGLSYNSVSDHCPVQLTFR